MKRVAGRGMTIGNHTGLKEFLTECTEKRRYLTTKLRHRGYRTFHLGTKETLAPLWPEFDYHLPDLGFFGDKILSNNHRHGSHHILGAPTDAVCCGDRRVFEHVLQTSLDVLSGPLVPPKFVFLSSNYFSHRKDQNYAKTQRYTL